ncbi:hypothetical protein [Gloeocapsa sp. PCC 73106]|uniref:hypothetical protein n=1 Tax=Gloeocapsa sp. PCC 73106 TaxID=102232 RepID=UPI0002ABA13A|nr:hypothetical protein [Gloeocapsa sp. PCC 73106]ELR99650.1 hypothetical protein GLO73106DRAFT_00035020 [Gloeocapsa sp. PCC 73106]
MKFSGFSSLLLAVILGCLVWLITPNALASTPIRLFDISYQDCTGDVAEGNVSSGGGSLPVNCFIVSGKAENKSGKMVVDADVFGRIYDANHNSVYENRGRVGSIAEIPPGVSDFSIRISVPADQPTPLVLEQFKASGFAAKVRPYYYDED